MAKVRDGGRLTPGTPPYMNDKWEELMTGFDFGQGFGLCNAAGARDGRDDAAHGAAWEVNREALIRACRETYGPGCRPAAWLEYDAPRTIRESFSRRDLWAPNRPRPCALPREYLTLMRQFGLLTPEERTALGV